MPWIVRASDVDARNDVAGAMYGLAVSSDGRPMDNTMSHGRGDSGAVVVDVTLLGLVAGTVAGVGAGLLGVGLPGAVLIGWGAAQVGVLVGVTARHFVR